MNDVPKKQNDISELPYLDTFRYENLFNVYQNNNNQYFYNILSKINFPADMDETFYTIYTVPSDQVSYTFISDKFYGTITLWWLICAVNNIQNPVQFPKAGSSLKILLPSVARNVIQQLTYQK